MEQRPAKRPESRASSIFLSELPVMASDRARALVALAADNREFSAGLSVDVEVLGGYRKFGELTRRSKSRVEQGVVKLEDLSRLAAADRPRAASKQSSFVIDYDEPVLDRLAAELVTKSGKASPREVEAFVSEYINDKTYVRAFDIASRVATTRSGDCTEHAVLTAALLRRLDYAARVVFGVVLVGIHRQGGASEFMAAGHAWVEQYQDERWVVIDAALYLSKAESARSSESTVGVPGLPEGVTLRIAYLPINLLKDEGPGHSRSLLDEVGIDGVKRVVVDVRPRSDAD